MACTPCPGEAASALENDYTRNRQKKLLSDLRQQAQALIHQHLSPLPHRTDSQPRSGLEGKTGGNSGKTASACLSGRATHLGGVSATTHAPAVSYGRHLSAPP